MSRLVVSQRAWLAPAWVREDLSRKAQALPSLDLRFADTKSLADAVTGQSLITFTRASSGTYVGSDRLIKTATTNLLLRSEEFDNAGVWGALSATVSSNTQVAPNGTTSAETITDINGATTANVGCFQSTTLADSTNYTMSCYVKAGTKTTCRVGIRDKTGANIFANFNLATGTTTTGNAISSTIQNAGNGWYRCTAICTSATGATSPRGIVFMDIDSYTADGTGTIHVWGAQLEQSSTVSEYIPTTSTINSAPRFDHNPTTGESLGLLVEESRTNLCLQSENFSTTWLPTGLLAFGSGSTANAIAAPDGQITADLLVENTAASNHMIAQSINVTTGTVYTVSAFAKAAPTTRKVQLLVSNTNFGVTPSATFDLATGTITGNSNSTAIITPFPGGWYRVTMTTIAATSTGANNASIRLVDASNANSYTGDGTSGIYLWGAQLEAGAFPTSYIPTTTATATRSADVASITGTAFSSWYRQDEGTVFAEARTNATHGGTNSFPRVFALNDGGNNNSIEGSFRVLSSYTDAGYRVNAAGVNQAQFDTNDQRNGQRQSIGYAVNNFAFVVGGATVNADTSGSVPVTTQLRLGARGDGSSIANGTIRRLVYWGQRLPNNVLQAITQ